MGKEEPEDTGDVQQEGWLEISRTADGDFLTNGAFVALPPIPEGSLAARLRRAGLQFINIEIAKSAQLVKETGTTAD